MTDHVEFAQARAWLNATGADGVADREHALWKAEENLDFAETKTFDDDLAPEEQGHWVAEETRLADEVEWLRDEMLVQWRNRDTMDLDLTPEIQRHADVEQAKAWLGATDRDALDQWQVARDNAVNTDEDTNDNDRIVALWKAATSDAGASPAERDQFASAVDEDRETREHRVQQAQAWLKATNQGGHFEYQQNRGFADTSADAAGDDRRLVQRWLDETGGKVTPEQLRAETAEMREAEQSMRHRVTQRMRGWMPSREQDTSAEATRERGDAMEL